MTPDSVVLRRIMGTSAAVLLLAVGALVLEHRFAPPAGSYEVTADLGRAGVGLRSGSDVKVRGVNIGEVGEVRFEDGRARATLVLHEEPRLPPADELELVVTAKTLLGEKQVEISFDDERFGAEPHLAAGDTIAADRQPTELSEAIDVLEPFIAAIDPEELAHIVDALGDQHGEADVIAENLEVSQELFAFGSRTAGDTLDRIGAMADVSEAIAPATSDLARLNRTLPEATAVLTERQADIRDNLEIASRTAQTLTAFVETEQDAISRMLTTSQPVGDVLERQAPEIGAMVNGAFLYARIMGSGGMLLDDGSEWAGFRIFLDLAEVDPLDLLCHEVPELPGCEDRA